MKKEAVLHIPMSEYAHGIDENHYVFRLRTARGDIKKCSLFYGDTACRQTPILFIEEPMGLVAQDEFFDYYEVEMKGEYHRIYYYFNLNDGKEEVYYYSDFFRKELVDDRSEYYKLPFNRREDIADIPQWVKGAVVYNIFPDSFATGYRFIENKAGEKKFGQVTTRSRLGGTIRGIAENVDYLKALGITCIYINPIFAAGEYHKYDTLDYKSVDPCFGSNDDFKHMVQILHDHDIRVIIDGVFNHCGWEYPPFEDVVRQGESSPYKDWFYRLDFPVVKPDNPEDIPNYECFAYERLMPKLNTSNQEVKEYLLDVAVYWIREFDIDGWRLDVASEVNDDFWREFRKAVKAEKPDSFIIGEVWETAKHWLDGSQFDSTMNYDLRKFSMYFFAREEWDAASFDSGVTNMRMRYRKNLTYGQLNLLDSHDVSRFYSVCGERENAFKLAVLFQMTFVGVPAIFYGDEQGLAGIKELDYRVGMQWDENLPLYLFYQRLIRLRKKHEVLTEGEYRTICAEKGSMLYGYERYKKGHPTLRIYLNAGNHPANIKVSEEFGIIWSEGYQNGALGAKGFAIFKERNYN